MYTVLKLLNNTYSIKIKVLFKLINAKKIAFKRFNFFKKSSMFTDLITLHNYKLNEAKERTLA